VKAPEQLSLPLEPASPWPRRRLAGLSARQRSELLGGIRRAIVERDRGACVYCGKPDAGGDLVLDLVVPASEGGRPRWDNLQAACSQCRSEKGCQSALEFGMRRLEHLLRHPHTEGG
jgi:5-methylcytosine-specific restriction endonuclease McrA